MANGNGDCKPSIGAKFWVPILITSLFAAGSASWALFERANNNAIQIIAKENRESLKIVQDRNITQDQQILLILQRMEQHEKTLTEALDLLKKHIGMK